jgi:hypothetical protein
MILYNTDLPDYMSLRFTSVKFTVRVARSRARTGNYKLVDGHVDQHFLTVPLGVS